MTSSDIGPLILAIAICGAFAGVLALWQRDFEAKARARREAARAGEQRRDAAARRTQALATQRGLGHPEQAIVRRTSDGREYVRTRSGGCLRIGDAPAEPDGVPYGAREAARATRHIPSQVKIEVAARDHGACVRCGRTEDLQFDHVHPYSRGGESTVNNLQLLCGTCNRRKGACL
jgi:5-methylcytosine-specific restriction endonuclease McrA